MGPTRTLGMRLLCNFVNVDTIAYRIQYIARGSSCGSRRGCPCRSGGIKAIMDSGSLQKWSNNKSKQTLDVIALWARLDVTIQARSRSRSVPWV